jgi:ketopantoate reductase
VRTEIEALNGYVARRAAELGAEAPLNDLLARLVRMTEVRA